MLPALRTQWRVLLLAASAAFFAISFLPAQLLSIFNADMVFPVLAYRDVVAGHHLRDWTWGAAPFVFPDLTFIWALNFLGFGGLASLQITSILYFLGWLFLPTLVYRISGGVRLEVFVSLLLLFYLSIARRWLASLSLHLFIFAPAAHAGGNLTACACLGLLQAVRLRGWDWRLGVPLIVLGALGGLSDALFIVVFAVPAAGALAVQALYERSFTMKPMRLAFVVLVPALVGFWGRRFMPDQPAPGATDLHASAILEVVGKIGVYLNLSHRVYFTFILVDIGAVAGFVILLFLKHAVSKGILSSPFFFIWAYGALLIGCDWGAAILTGSYVDLHGDRYVMAALTFPVFLIAGRVASWSWRPSALTGLSLATAAVTIAGSFSPPVPSFEYAAALEALPQIRALIAATHTDAGLADYWDANMIRFVSHPLIPMGELDEKRGIARYWFTNSRWFRTDGRNGSTPTYGFLFTVRENLPVIRSLYGPPARVEKTALGDAWIYAPAAIHFNPLFGHLQVGNHAPSLDRFAIEARDLPSATGLVEGTARVARAGRDAPGHLTYGPYLDVAPGQYRLSIAYAYDASPAPGKLSSFDSIIHPSGGEQQLAAGPLPFHGTALQTLTQIIVVPEIATDRQQLEVRVQYEGSGDLRIDSLTITPVGP